MRRLWHFVAAGILLTVAILIVGTSYAGNPFRLSSRLARTDAQKLADQRSDAERWVDSDDDWNDDARARHRLVQEVAFRATGTLDIDGGANGGACVTGWGRDSIHATARIQAQARNLERARELAESVRIVRDGNRLTADGPDTKKSESWSATFYVLAPRNTELRLQALNGPTTVTDLDSKMEIETVNGPLALSAVSGDVRARTENGPLSVILTGSRWKGAGLDASTQNGPVALLVPRDYNCTLETGTINGPMTVGIPVVMQGRINMRHQHITTKLGSGGAPVRATTINGPATVSYIGEAKAEVEEVEN